MIREEICTYEVCKLAKEKGFPQEIDFGGYWYATKYYKNACLGEYFEEERTTDLPHYYWNFITDGNGKTLKVGNKMFATYELALEDAELYCLKNLL